MITVWSPKGGQGLSVTVAALALAHLRHDGASVAIVDLAGDQPAVLGVEGVGSVGVLDWLGSRASPQALGRTAIEVIDGLTLIPRGGGPPSVRPRPTDAPEVARPSRVVELWGAIDGLADLVLVDAGVPAPAPGALRLAYGADLSRQAVRAAATNIVVVRACYLALRRFGRLDLAADAIVFLREPRRALVAADLETTVGAPVVGTVEIDPAVARATDSGLLTSRLPRRLERQLVDVVPTARRAGSVFGGCDMTGDADVLRNRARLGAAAVSPPLIARVRELLEASRPDGDWTLDEVKAVLHRADPLIDEAESAELLSGVHAELVGLGAVAALLATPGVTDVLVNGPGPVWIERAGALERTSVVLDAGDVARLVERTLGPLGRRVDPALPIADAAMADGTRVAVVVPPVALGGPVLAYRRFEVRAVPLDRFASPRVEAALEAVIARRYNTVVFGGTGAGKTTLLDALCARLPPEERLVVVEDTAELAPPGRHLVRLEARRANAEGSGSVELGDLVRTALRLRPDRLIVGEVRGGEAADLVTALSTGHDGGLSTVHAGSPAEALDRLESMTLLGAPGLGVAGIRRRLHAAIDVLVGVARRGDGARSVTGVWRVAGSAESPEFEELTPGVEIEAVGR